MYIPIMYIPIIQAIKMIPNQLTFREKIVQPTRWQ